MLIEGINPSIRIHGLNDILHVQAYRLWMEYPSRDLDEFHHESNYSTHDASLLTSL